MKTQPCNFVWVLDLDDTLYKERDYLISGLKAVAACVEEIYEVDLLEKILDWQSLGVDVFQKICENLLLPSPVKESLLWVYRNHNPKIRLNDEAKKFIDFLFKEKVELVILTDGRSISQRKKVKSLGLEKIPLYISEEHSSMKPEPYRFELIMQNHKSADKYVYIADNPAKDFKAPKDLGWWTIGLNGHNKNIHSQCLKNIPENFHPDIWINSLTELMA